MEKDADQFASIVKDRLQSLSDLVSTEHNIPALSLETLLDTFVAVYADCKAATNQNEQITGFLSRYNPTFTKVQSMRLNTKDFETIKTLATGAVGRVCLVRSKKTKQVYALKILKKQDLLTRQEAAFFMEERNALVFAQKSDWITTLYAAFQDEDNLYLLMEYVSGGSMRALLNNREDIMKEDEARFYIMEMILSVAELHSHSYIHRDIKPENYLVDSNGHIKLADFGSCVRVSETARVNSHETVGTPDYISPEILKANEGEADYGIEVDWWSIGIILYELLCDEVPFYSESLVGTYGKIMNHKKHFAFPEDVELSEDCKDLISKLICDQSVRLGKSGVQEIKNHPWFKGIDWENIRNAKAPFVPQLSGPEDTRYFEDEDTEAKKFVKKALTKTKEFTGISLAFVGYNYMYNSTAFIQYPGTTAGAAPALSRTVAQHNSQTSMNGSTALLADKGLESKVATYENEIKLIKQNLVTEKEKAITLETQLMSVTKEQTKLTEENRSIKKSLQDQETEKHELEDKVSYLQRKIKDNSNNQQELTALLEEKVKLEGQVSQALQDLKIQTEESEKGKQNILELTKIKSALDLKINELSDTIKSNLLEKEVLLQKENANVHALLEKNHEISDLQMKHQMLTTEKESIVQNLKAKDDQLLNKGKVIESQNEKIESFERQVVVLNMEKQSLQSRIDDLETEIQRITAELSNIHNSQKDRNSGELESIKQQLESQIQAHKLKSNELQAANKSIALLDLERLSLKKQIESFEAIKDDYSKKVQQSDDKISELTGNMEKLQVERNSLLTDLSLLNSTLSQVKQRSETLEVSNRELEHSIDQQKLVIQSITNELDQMTLKHKAESQRADGLQNKCKELEQSLTTEHKIRTRNEEHNVNLEAQVLVLSKKLAAQKQSSSEDTQKEIKELKDDLLSMETNNRILTMNYATQTEALQEAQDEKVKLQKDIEEIRNEVNQSISAYEDQLAVANQKISELLYELTKTKNLSSDRLQDLEVENEVLRNKVEGNSNAGSISTRENSIRREMRPLEKDKEKSISNSRFRLSGMFFRSKENLLDNHEGGDDNNHKRAASQQSALSLGSTGNPIGRSPSMAIVEMYNPSEPLAGWIKVPKGGKVKKGWKRLFMAFFNDKLFTYETEEEYREHSTGTMVCDISCEIFVARTVSQNELIHASANDIDLIFKIQAANSSSVADKERIEHLKSGIAVEEKMQMAANKMLSVLADAQKMTVINQIDASSKRLRSLKAELEKLEAGSSSSSNHPWEDSETDMETFRKDFKAQLDDELMKREALGKLAAPQKKKKHSNDQAKNIEMEILTSDRLIAKLKENIEILDSKNSAKIQEMLIKSKQSVIASDSKGHIFSQRQYFKHVDCGLCNESLWDTKNIGYECASCKLICHKNCKTNLDISCQNQAILRDIQPIYFMAEGSEDRLRWLAGLSYYRKELETRDQSLNISNNSSTPAAGRLQSYISPLKSTAASPLKARFPTVNEKRLT